MKFHSVCFWLFLIKLTHSCSTDEYTCNDLSCVPFHKVNDGIIDCPTNFDDENGVYSCYDGMLKCSGFPHICIDFFHVCNGRNDCPFGEDEEFCEGCANFNCDNGKCLNSSTVCQTKEDCIPSCMCPLGHTICNNNEFIEECGEYKQICIKPNECKKICQKPLLTCGSSKKCYSKDESCNDEVFCQSDVFFDTTDENMCCKTHESDMQCYEDFSGECNVSYAQVCNNHVDCNNAQDENYKIGCLLFPLGCDLTFAYNHQAQAYHEDIHSNNYYFSHVFISRRFITMCEFPNWRKDYEEHRYKFQSMSKTSFLAMNITNAIICITGFLFGLPLNVLLAGFLIDELLQNNFNFLFIFIGTIIDILNISVRISIMSVELIAPKWIFRELTYTSHTAHYDYPDYFIVCRIINIIRAFNQFLSPAVLVVIAFERLILTKFSLRAKFILTNTNRSIGALILLFTTLIVSFWYAVQARWDFMDFGSRWVIFDTSVHCVFGILPLYKYTNDNPLSNPISIVGKNKFFNSIIEIFFSVILPLIVQICIYCGIYFSKSNSKFVNAAKKRFTRICLLGSLVYFLLSLPLIFTKCIVILHSYRISWQYYDVGEKSCPSCMDVSISKSHFWSSTGVFAREIELDYYELSDFERYIVRVSESAFIAISIVNPMVYLIIFKVKKIFKCFQRKRRR